MNTTLKSVFINNWQQQNLIQDFLMNLNKHAPELWVRLFTSNKLFSVKMILK